MENVWKKCSLNCYLKSPFLDRVYFSNHFQNMFSDCKTKNTNLCSISTFSRELHCQTDYPTPKCLFCFHSPNTRVKNKSFEDLQVEVDDLIQFRNKVINTFPELATEISMHSTVSSQRNISSKNRIQAKSKKSANTIKNLEVNSTKAVEDEPQTSYRQSSSNCCKRESKSGEPSGGAVQDSGFSTETSSKDCYSATAFSGVSQGIFNNVTNRPICDTDDELLNLLDVVFRKTSSQSYGLQISSACITNVLGSSTVRSKVGRFGNNCSLKHNFLKLNKERDKLLIKMAELESTLIKNQIIISVMEQKIHFFLLERITFQDQLKKAINEKQNLSKKTEKSPTTNVAEQCKSEMFFNRQYQTCEKRKDVENTEADPSSDEWSRLQEHSKLSKPCGTKFNSKPVLKKTIRDLHSLDSTDIAAILLETNPLELQKHLLRLMVLNKSKIQSATSLDPACNLHPCLHEIPSKHISTSPSYRFDCVDNSLIDNTYIKCKTLGFISGAVDDGNSPMSLTDFKKKKNTFKRLKPSKIPIYSSMSTGSPNVEKKSSFTQDEKMLSLNVGNNSMGNLSNKQSVLKKKTNTKNPITLTSTKISLSDNKFLPTTLPKNNQIVQTGRLLSKNSLEKYNKDSRNMEYAKSHPSYSASSVIQNSYLASCTKSPSRSYKQNNSTPAFDSTASNLLLTEPHTKLETETIGHSFRPDVQLLVGEENKNTYRTSILGSINNKNIKDDDAYIAGEIGRVRNLRSTLLGWLKI